MRKLNESELKRKVVFEELTEKLINQGYKKKELGFDLIKANTVSIFLALPFIIIFSFLFFYKNGASDFIKLLDQFSILNYLLFLAVFFVLIIFHELIHGISWSLFTKNGLKSIEYGIIWATVNPYCTCSEPMKKWQYIIGAIMPTVILGIVPAIISIVINSAIIFSMSLVMIMSGSGDMYVINEIRKTKDDSADQLYLDHPYDIGMVIFEK